MNMIPLVMANEPGRAHYVNLDLTVANCSLEDRIQCWRPRKSLWKKAA